jgi:hypothetical protein
MAMKRSTLWDIMLCSLMYVKRYFGGTHHPHLQGGGVTSRNRRQAEPEMFCGSAIALL